MKLRADFDQRVAVTPEQYEWVPSPAPGVERMMLDRVGAEARWR
jgi:anti-sigma factor ChrR (cupin superfamily)